MALTLNRVSVGVLLAAAFFATNSIAGEREKVPTPLEIQFAGIEKIVVLPPVDVRNGEKASVKPESIQKQVLRILKKKNYAIEAAVVSGDPGDLVEEDLKEARPEWVRTLGPADARWVMVVCLNDVTSKMTFGSTGNAELSGYLYDKQEGRLVWQDKGIGQAGQGGLAGMMLKGTMKGQALNIAIGNLMRSVPKRPKVKK